MSIVALKRKTAVQYDSMSVGRPAFALNGTRRLQGYVGQTSLSRNNPPTVMRGNAIRGHGGCCGRYPVFPLIQQVHCITEDSNVVKTSVLSTRGMIATKYPWIRRPAPITSVKPDTTLNINTQEQHIAEVRKRTLNAFTGPCEVKTKKPVISCDPSRSNLNVATCPNAFVAESGKHLYRDASDYTDLRSKKVVTDNDVAFVARATQNTPFTCA